MDSHPQPPHANDEIHSLEALPPVLRAMAEAWLGDCGSDLGQRLRRSSRIAAAAAENVPRLKPVAGELMAAAEALHEAVPPPRMKAFRNLLQLPADKTFVAALPEENRDEWRALNDGIVETREHLTRFTAAGWARGRGPAALRVHALRLRGDRLLGEDAALLAANASRLADAELMLAGVALMGVSRNLARLAEIIVPLFIVCDSSDACTLGHLQDCEAGDLYFPPYEDGPGDADDFEDALTLLKGAGWLLPAKYLTPGGKKMIKEIAERLEEIKKRTDKKKIGLRGYGVYMVLNYQECVDGWCGNYWDDKAKVVKLDPPAGKKHLTGDGWKASVIEDLGKDEAATERQMREFKRLAEDQCP